MYMEIFAGIQRQFHSIVIVMSLSSPSSSLLFITMMKFERNYNETKVKKHALKSKVFLYNKKNYNNKSVI